MDKSYDGLLDGLREALHLGVQNQEEIRALKKELTTKIGNVYTELGQFQVKQDIVIQQSVREEMYEQIKQNNIAITKRIEELKALTKRQLTKNEQDIRAQLASFAEEKDDFAIKLEDYKKTMQQMMNQAKSVNLESQGLAGPRRITHNIGEIQKSSRTNSNSQSPTARKNQIATTALHVLNQNDESIASGTSKKVRALEEGLAAMRQKLLELHKKFGNGKIDDLGTFAANLEARLDKVEKDLVIDLDGS